MTTDKQKRRTVFISYSHSDSEILKRLQVHLKPLEREGKVDHWDDTKIRPGQRWKEEIKQAIASAKVAVLLLSADFLASDFIASDELPPLLTAAATDGLDIICVIIEPCLYKQIKSLSQFQALNSPDKPWIKMDEGEREELWVKLTKEIVAMLPGSPEPKADPLPLTPESPEKAIDETPPLDIEESKMMTRQTGKAMREIRRLMSSFIPDFAEKFPENFQDKLVSEIRGENLFRLQTFRAFVFGRIGAGKTTTINYLLDNDVFPATGELNCTRSLAAGEHKSGLIFYDSPGIGDKPRPENTTRTALCINQLDEDRIDTVRLIDITSKNAEGPLCYKTLSYEEFENEIKSEYYSENKEKIIVKEFPLIEFKNGPPTDLVLWCL